MNAFFTMTSKRPASATSRVKNKSNGSVLDCKNEESEIIQTKTALLKVNSTRPKLFLPIVSLRDSRLLQLSEIKKSDFPDHPKLPCSLFPPESGRRLHTFRPAPNRTGP